MGINEANKQYSVHGGFICIMRHRRMAIAFALWSELIFFIILKLKNKNKKILQGNKAMNPP